MENMDWLEEEIGEFENDYLIIDCPGGYDFRAMKSVETSDERYYARSD